MSPIFDVPDVPDPDAHLRLRLIHEFPVELASQRFAVIDRNGRPLDFFMTAGPISDYAGAVALLNGLPLAEWRVRKTFWI
ncbi:MAG: hypothetical protein ABF669_14995 [Gluconobacter oxydans]